MCALTHSGVFGGILAPLRASPVHCGTLAPYYRFVFSLCFAFFLSALPCLVSCATRCRNHRRRVEVDRGQQKKRVIVIASHSMPADHIVSHHTHTHTHCLPGTLLPLPFFLIRCCCDRTELATYPALDSGFNCAHFHLLKKVHSDNVVGLRSARWRIPRFASRLWILTLSRRNPKKAVCTEFSSEIVANMVKSTPTEKGGKCKQATKSIVFETHFSYWFWAFLYVWRVI